MSTANYRRRLARLNRALILARAARDWPRVGAVGTARIRLIRSQNKEN